MVFMILKNGTYGAPRWFAEGLKSTRCLGLTCPVSTFSLSLSPRAMAWRARATTADDLEHAMTAALGSLTPILIEVPTPRRGKSDGTRHVTICQL